MIGRIKFLLFISVFFFACSTTRTIPKDDALYTGATVKLNADIPLREKKVFTSDLQASARPKPNSSFLGIPFKLLIWNAFGNKKPNSFFGKLRGKLGEPPVLASQVNVQHNVDIFQNQLQNKGFFTAQVSGDTTIKGKKAHAYYTANAGSQYKIASVEFVNDSSKLTQAILACADKSLLKAGNSYDLDVITGERNRIDAYLKEHGFYYFSPDFLIIQVDSVNAGNHLVNMRVRVKPTTPLEGRDVYTINNVYIYSNYSLNTANTDTSKANRQFYDGYYIIDAHKKFRPKLFDEAMQFRPGDIYNRTDHNNTLNRLMNANVFKFVKNRFERAKVDSPKLDVSYYLTPFPTKSIRAEFGLSNQSNNFNGTTVSLGYHHRNLFRAGEQFDFKIYGGTETSFGGTYQGYNTFKYGTELDLAIPRFIVPFFKFSSRGPFMPHTNFQMAYESLDRIGLYSLQSFRLSAGYSWKKKQEISQELFPISINYVVPSNISLTFDTTMRNDPTLKHVVDTTVILGSTYQFTFNQQAAGIQKINSFFFNGLADVSGNVAGLFLSGNQKSVFGVPFAQYIKFEADGRYYRKLGLGSTWANRIDFGYGLPYGNSNQLPYVKQFFTGGNNSIRAFRSRTVGPGIYHAVQNNAGFIPDQTGDIKLELNTEYRPKISGPLYGAVFIDAGNIWLSKPDPNKPGAEFTGQFLSQLAVGGGVGIRLDIQIFVLRFDVAWPLREPWLNNPWVINQINFGSTQWRRENVIYNLAIGYPF